MYCLQILRCCYQINLCLYFKYSMKISFQNTYQPNFCSRPFPKIPGNKLAKITDIPEDVFQRSLPDLDRILPPIKDAEEFNQVFRRVVNEISYNGEYAWYSEKDHELYKNISNTERGLIPYCGYNDKSKYINMFLSGRLTEEAKQKYQPFLPMNEESFIDVIRALEYSLKDLNKTYGKHKGIVFRQGYMSENPRQYISSTTDSIIANCFNNNYLDFSPTKGYSVIRTFNGYKINEFQKKMNSEFATSEQEILLPFRNIYKKLNPEDLDDELYYAKETMATNLFKGAKEVMAGTVRERNGFTRQNLLDMVNVYQEIIPHNNKIT